MYDVTPMKAPRAAGLLLRTLVGLLEQPAIAPLLVPKLMRDVGIDRLRQTPTADPLPAVHPLFLGRTPDASLPALDPGHLAWPEAPRPGFAFETSRDFTAAYRTGGLSPVEVAERLVARVRVDAERSPAMRIVVEQHAADLMAQAAASAERYRSGRPLGPLDGVPVSVKDELDMAGYRTTVGTSFLGKQAASADAEVVARLRAAGALLVGKVNMHEIGLGVTGLNPHHGAVRNPYDPARATGGSSSGSAAAVAAGYGPIAIGADGGGSIRIPAAHCGVVGLKATYGRLSEHGAAPLCWSVAHVGPIGATVHDVALAYALMAGPDAKDPNSLYQPAPSLQELERADLRGIRLGVYQPWFEDAEPAVVAACRTMLEALEAAGAEIVAIEIPELGLLNIAHTVTIVSEMLAAHAPYFRAHPEAYGLDTRLNLILARHLQATDYLLAQRHRVRLCGHFERVLGQVDAIVTPTTGCPAHVLPADALAEGESNLELLDRIMRFVRVANFTGLPAISFPAGYDPHGMPIGLQVIGRAWQEDLLLRIALAGEGALERRAPQVHHRLLEGIGERVLSST